MAAKIAVGKKAKKKDRAFYFLKFGYFDDAHGTAYDTPQYVPPVLFGKSTSIADFEAAVTVRYGDDGIAELTRAATAYSYGYPDFEYRVVCLDMFFDGDKKRAKGKHASDTAVY